MPVVSGCRRTISNTIIGNTLRRILSTNTARLYSLYYIVVMVFSTRSSNWNSADYCCRGTSVATIKTLKKKISSNDIPPQMMTHMHSERMTAIKFRPRTNIDVISQGFCNGEKKIDLKREVRYTRYNNSMVASDLP